MKEKANAASGDPQTAAALYAIAAAIESLAHSVATLNHNFATFVEGFGPTLGAIANSQDSVAAAINAHCP